MKTMKKNMKMMKKMMSPKIMKTFKQYLSEQLSDKKQLYLDLDGVLVNLGKHIKQFGLGTFEEIDENGTIDLLWDKISEVGSDFWKNAPWMKDGKELWEYAKQFDPIILTAPPNTGGALSAKGKKEWVSEQLGQDVKVIVVPAYMKRKYSNENSILVDDMERNINQWIAKKGIGVRHLNSKDTINTLKNIFGEIQ